MKSKFAAFLLTLTVAPQAFAGIESHGGQAVFCPGKPPVTLDYYQATLPTLGGGAPSLIDLSSMDAATLKQIVKSKIGESELWMAYNRASAILGDPSTWLESNLVLVSDSEPAFTLPAGCELKQVAIRQDSTMYVDPAVYKQLSPAQQGILQVHESLYYVSQQNGFNSSVQVREVIRNLLMVATEPVALSMAVHEMGSKFFWWERLNGMHLVQDSPLDPGLKVGAEANLKYDPMLDGMQISIDALIPKADGTEEMIGRLVCQLDKGQCLSIYAGGGCSLLAIGWAMYTGDVSCTLKCSSDVTNHVFYMKGKAQ